MQEMLFQRPKFYKFPGGWGGMHPDPLTNLYLWYSAHTFGEHILSCGGGCGQGKWALWQFCPTTEESLKNAMAVNTKLTSKVPFLFGNFQFFKNNSVKNVQFSYGTTRKFFSLPPPVANISGGNFLGVLFNTLKCP